MINFRTVFCLGGLKTSKIILNNQTCSVLSAELEWGGSLLDVSGRDERPPEEPVHQENCQNTFQHNHRQEDRHLRIRFQKGESFICSYNYSNENGVPSSMNHFAANWAFRWEWWHIFYSFWLKAELNCYSDLVALNLRYPCGWQFLEHGFTCFLFSEHWWYSRVSGHLHIKTHLGRGCHVIHLRPQGFTQPDQTRLGSGGRRVRWCFMVLPQWIKWSLRLAIGGPTTAVYSQRRKVSWSIIWHFLCK